MGPTPTAVPARVSDAELLADAVETDRRYFEMGSSRIELPGASLFAIPGLGTLPAAVVVQGVDPDVAASLGDRWVRLLEQQLARIGAPLARIYLDHEGTPLERLLESNGYVGREELAFMSGDLEPPDESLVLRRVEGAEAWEAKRRFHDDAVEAPDGHGTAPGQWFEMERARCRDGGMEPFLAEIDGEVVGSINAIRTPRLLRMKNVMTHPAHRRRGVGRGMIGRLNQLARAEGLHAVCVFAVAGEEGENLYRAAGMRITGVQVEWSRKLG